MSHHIPVVFCFDKHYAPYAAVASYSLCAHAKSGLKLIWLVPSDDMDEVAPVIRYLTQEGMGPRVIPVTGHLFAGWYERDYISVSSYFRLLIPELVEDSKVIYIDSDTLVLDDLRALYSIDMLGCAIAGVEDISGTKDIQIPLPPEAKYINSGVLLMDLDKLRADDFFVQCQRIHAEHSDKLRWMDQCLINCYLGGRTKMLDARWNQQILPNWTMPEAWQAATTSAKPAVMHFLGAVKPWQDWCNPLVARYWWHHARQSGIPWVPRVPISQLDHKLELARVLDMSQHFAVASELKSQIIKDLMDKK